MNLNEHAQSLDLRFEVFPFEGVVLGRGCDLGRSHLFSCPSRRHYRQRHVLVLRAQAQADQRQCCDFAFVCNSLFCLEAL